MRITSLIPPHGGILAEQSLPMTIAHELTGQLTHGPSVDLDPFHYFDVICLATGVYSPLTGFQNRFAVETVLSDWQLPEGELWPIPITLPISSDASAQVKKYHLVRLRYQGKTVAVMHVDDVFWLDPEREAQMIYGTTDAKHPGVHRVFHDSPIRMAGPVTLTREPSFQEQPVLTPREMRHMIADRGWRQVVAFQTRNPLHRAHEYIQKMVLETVDGLVIHPLIGATKADDVPASIRWHAYQALLRNYYPANRALLSAFPASMRYAGPREAVLHALARKNYGFTHFIVGRDHAGVGSFYHPLASQRIFERFPQGSYGMTIIPAEPAFYCRRCEQMATEKTCPHPAESHEVLSGTRVRTTLSQGESLPPHTIRPEVEEILKRYYQHRM